MEEIQGTGESKILAGVNSLSSEVESLRDKCLKIRKLMDEGTYKLNSSLNVLTKLKTQEQNMINIAGQPEPMKKMSEEQIEGLLEMLKTPAFQNLAKQVMVKWLAQKE